MESAEENDFSTEHIPVLNEPLAERISLPTDGTVLDLTLGYGGHSFQFGKRLGPEGAILGLDVDKKCLSKN